MSLSCDLLAIRCWIAWRSVGEISLGEATPFHQPPPAGSFDEIQGALFEMKAKAVPEIPQLDDFSTNAQWDGVLRRWPQNAWRDMAG
jgi:hypothetical protein